MEKILASKAKIRFQDCDPFNDLNNSKYLDYFINAREDQVKENYNLDIFEMIKTEKIGWVVATNQIAYLQPAFTMETVTIKSQLIQFSEKSLLVEMTMWDESASKLKAVSWSKFIHVDIRTQSSMKHSEKLLELFQSIVVPSGQHYFEERCKELMATLK